MKPIQAKVAGTPRKIVDFHEDEFFDWIADLECGHQQHVRHNPPWTTRHWVTTHQGRLDHIGLELACSLCSTVASPQTVVLNTTTSRINGVIVVYLSGGIFFGEQSAFLQPLVKDLLNESRKIVFDFGNVTHLDSGGVGILVAVFATARKVGGDIKFANLGNHTNEVLHTTNLVTVFEIFRTTRDAIASFIQGTTAFARITNS